MPLADRINRKEPETACLLTNPEVKKNKTIKWFMDAIDKEEKGPQEAKEKTGFPNYLEMEQRGLYIPQEVREDRQPLIYVDPWRENNSGSRYSHYFVDFSSFPTYF